MSASAEASNGKAPVDKPRIEAAMREVLSAIGEDPNREGLRDTPRRIADVYEEILGGMRIEPTAFLTVGFEEAHDEMVILRDIPFFSMCEHHLLPFHGVVHVSYIPNGRVVGISKIARLVDAIAQRLQLQERLTCAIADTLMSAVAPQGVAVACEAEHLCMTMRGIKKPGSRMVTSALRGSFATEAVTRAEFLSLLKRRDD